MFTYSSVTEPLIDPFMKFIEFLQRARYSGPAVMCEAGFCFYMC